MFNSKKYSNVLQKKIHNAVDRNKLQKLQFCNSSF